MTTLALLVSLCVGLSAFRVLHRYDAHEPASNLVLAALIGVGCWAGLMGAAP